MPSAGSTLASVAAQGRASRIGRAIGRAGALLREALSRLFGARDLARALTRRGLRPRAALGRLGQLARARLPRRAVTVALAPRPAGLFARLLAALGPTARLAASNVASFLVIGALTGALHARVNRLDMRLLLPTGGGAELRSPLDGACLLATPLRFGPCATSDASLWLSPADSPALSLDGTRVQP
eukprot:scaffold170079_cov14-Tisochrysis_lutea.AAC.1